jgi:hypothetical protein
MAQEQQYHDALVTMERDKIAQAAKIHEDAMLGVQLPPEMGGGRSPKELLPFLYAKADAEAKRREDAAKLGGMQAAILNQPARAEAPMPAEGGMYSEAETLPGKAATPKNVMLAAILGHPQAEAILKQMYPEDTEKNQLVSDTTRGYLKNGVYTEIPGGGPKPKYTVNTVPTQEGVIREVVDEMGNVIRSERVGSPVQQPREPKEPAQQSAATIYNAAVEGLLALRRQGVPETDPRVAEASSRVNMLKPVMIAEGGNLGGAAGGPPLAVGNPPRPSASERTALSDLDTQINAFTDLSARAKTPEVSAGLGLKSAPSRFLEDKFNIPTLSDPVRQFRAEAAIHNAAKKSLIGVNQTRSSALAPPGPAERERSRHGGQAGCVGGGGEAQSGRDRERAR